MKTWHTNANIETDTRYSAVVRWAVRSRWVPWWVCKAINSMARLATKKAVYSSRPAMFLFDDACVSRETHTKRHG